MRPAGKIMFLALAASVWLGCSSYHDRVWRCPDGQCGFLSGRFDGCSNCTNCPTCGKLFGHCTCHPLQRLGSRVTCGEGCGQIYFSDWLSDPPDKCDPCDPVSGCYVGRRNCTHGCSGAMQYRLCDALIGRRCANNTCGTAGGADWAGSGTVVGNIVGDPVDESPPLGWGDRALMGGGDPSVSQPMTNSPVQRSQPMGIPSGSVPAAPRATSPPASSTRPNGSRSNPSRAPRNALPADDSPQLEEAGEMPEARLQRPAARTMSAKKTVGSGLRR